MQANREDLSIIYANESASNRFTAPIGKSLPELIPSLNIHKLKRRIGRGRDFRELCRIEEELSPQIFEVCIFLVKDTEVLCIEIINLNRILEQEALVKSYTQLVEEKNRILIETQEIIRQFPESNPNPVLRISVNKIILYANPAGHFILGALELDIGSPISDQIFEEIAKEDSHGFDFEVETMWFRVRSFWAQDFGFYLLYFTNITPQKQNELLLSNLSRYFSPHVFRSIFTADAALNVQTRRKKLTIFFSDIEGFTSLSERLEPELLTDLLTEYLTEMTTIADKHGGTVDKYIGDAIMVFFGDPIDHGVKTDAKSCVFMALEMIDRLHILRKKWQTRGIAQPLNIRIGIHSDVCTVGNFGSQHRLDYTAIGNGINLASRLEGKAESNQILISEETYLLIKDEVNCKNLGEFYLKNIAYPVRIFEVLSPKNSSGEYSKMNLDLPGMNLEIDTNDIVDSNQVIVSLQNILNYLKHSNQKQ